MCNVHVALDLHTLHLFYTHPTDLPLNLKRSMSCSCYGFPHSSTYPLAMSLSLWHSPLSLRWNEYLYALCGGTSTLKTVQSIRISVRKF